MRTLSTAAWVAHNLGLGACFGGLLFGKAALNPRGCYELWLGNGTISVWILENHENHTRATFPTRSGRSSPRTWRWCARMRLSASTTSERFSTD